MTEALYQRLAAKLSGLVRDEPMSRHCTIRVGGPAAAFVAVRTLPDLIAAVTMAESLEVRYHILGGGSNTLFADHGFDGLVIKNIANQVTMAGAVELLEESDWTSPAGEVRHEAANPGQYVSFLDLNYEERSGDTLVTAESGVNLTALIVKTLDVGLTGLEWFGGIPGVIGGAVYNNIHGGTHFLGERLVEVTVLTPNLQKKIYPQSALELGYDQSRFQRSGEIILVASFRLTRATTRELQRAEYTFREWIKRKSAMQPRLGSMGSTFQNIAQDLREKIGAPTSGAGWLIDQCGLKGYRVGNAQIAPEHANFIVNHGGATAAEVYALIRLAKDAVKKKFGVTLKEEVFLIGDWP